MRCKDCGEDIGDLGDDFTIYEGKKWCECRFVKTLIRKTRKHTLNQIDKHIEKYFISWKEIGDYTEYHSRIKKDLKIWFKRELK